MQTLGQEGRANSKGRISDLNQDEWALVSVWNQVK